MATGNECNEVKGQKINSMTKHDLKMSFLRSADNLQLFMALNTR